MKTSKIESFESRVLGGGAMVVALFLLFAAAGCSASAAESKSAGVAKAGSAINFSEADLAALEKGYAEEAALVRGARKRADEAATPQERAQASQAEWEDQTTVGGAKAAGMSVERYRAVRKAVGHVLETLDLQGKIEGPMEIDMEHASPDMKQRLAGDAYSDLPPAAAATLRAHLNEVVAAWVGYMKLVAING